MNLSMNECTALREVVRNLTQLHSRLKAADVPETHEMKWRRRELAEAIERLENMIAASKEQGDANT